MTGLSRAQRAKYQQVIGSRRQVWNGSAHHTSGGLTRGQLFMTKNGRIVSKSKHFSAKKDKRLIKAGYGTRKGKFGFVMLNGKGKKGSRKNKTMKKRGGYAGHLPLSPDNYDGQGVGTSGVALQEVAGQAGGRHRRGHKGTRRHKRGGYSGHLALSPTPYDGQGVGTSGVALQEVAGQAGGSGFANLLDKIKGYTTDVQQGGRRRRRSGSRRRGGGVGDLDA